MPKELYFLGICPTGRLKEDIHQQKSIISQKYNTKGAFRSSAHITLQMPFKLGQKKLIDFEQDIFRFSEGVQPFNIQLDGFSAFEPRVVYIVVKENEKLNHLHKALEPVLKRHQIFNSTHKNRGFHPHITVAFRDLKKRDFYPLWEEMKNKEFKREFKADGMMLYRHNGSVWEEYKHIPFGTTG
ncbi:2'-5' RNA ligase family protein [Marivirga sp. S37H4]|uniref:2'-5' RNA ligase family protein n=1 Tax=Marivirga aurantiaca TaxID=2802615 RepID=A0A934WZV4_9BACT|nr:2'-5' RNA ligase family protein [Marivirga aurantiaca]MBK6265816.1 2'-5' RNA ligase family protein [Marivirga aurantiaca]